MTDSSSTVIAFPGAPRLLVDEPPRAAALPQAAKARVDLAFLIGDSVIVDGRMGVVRGIRIGTSPMAVIYEVASPCGRPLGWFPDFQMIDAE